MEFNTCNHSHCGNFVYTTVSYEMVFDSKIETLLRINGTPKQICNAFHGWACHPDGLSAGLKNPCNCSRCATQLKEILEKRKQMRMLN